MPGVHVCAICDYAYDETDRKPLVLLCGHTYCQQCLHIVVSGSSPACPSCRKEIVTPVDELPVIFALIPPTEPDKAASKSVGNRESSCRAHQHELDYWCTRCQISICKRCLADAHADHKFTLIEEMIADKKLLSDKKDQITTELQQTRTSIETVQLLESVGSKIYERKSEITGKINSLQMKQIILTEWVEVLKKISSEPSQKQVSVMVKLLKHQTPALTEVGLHGALEEINNWISQLQVSTKPDETAEKTFETYMPDGQQWNIISTELGEKALNTMKETDHKTPKATVISTDESPILCLPELLQYLAASSPSMELQVMDKSEKKYLDKTNWFPLIAGSVKSTNYKHCYRLKVLMDALVYFQTLTSVTTTFGQVMYDSSRNKVIALLYPATATYDVYVLAYGKIVKSAAGSWPLPLEVHVVDLAPEQWLWVTWPLPFLYSMAQPKMGVCRVYLPGYDSRCLSYPNERFSVFAELGRKFSTQHRLYLPGSVPDYWRAGYREAAEEHKIALEFRDF